MSTTSLFEIENNVSGNVVGLIQLWMERRMGDGPVMKNLPDMRCSG